MLVREQMHFCCEEGGRERTSIDKKRSGGEAEPDRQKTDRDKIRAGEGSYEPTREVGGTCPLPSDATTEPHNAI